MAVANGAKKKAARPASRKPVASKPVRGSRTGRPIMVLFDLLGRRWTLRLLWELRDGALSFRALRAAMEDVSPSVLNERLRALREAGLVAREEGAGYVLTPLAEELASAHLLPLDAWARRWAKGRARAGR